MINFTIAINSEYIKEIENSVVSCDPIELDSKDGIVYNNRDWLEKRLNDVIKEYLSTCCQYKEKKDAAKKALVVDESILTITENKDA